MAHDNRFAYALDVTRRAFAEFLALPTLVIGSFLLLAAGTYALDKSSAAWLRPARIALEAIFTDAGSTADVLSTIAGSLITVTSITISLLLVAVQQSAGTMTAQVFDQFLRRRLNQFHFGFFVGLSVLALLVLVTVDDPFNPVFGATVTFVLTVVALFLLIVLLYSTIDQMRPVEIIETIHDHVLQAREHERRLLALTRRASGSGNTEEIHQNHVARSHAESHGFVTEIHLDDLRAMLSTPPGSKEVKLEVSIGSYVAFHDLLAECLAPSHQEAARLARAAQSAVHIERQRNIAVDPAYGIAQLETIAWTSISTAKSDPAPGILTIYALRDVLARWSAAEPVEERGDAEGADRLAVVYVDRTRVRLIEAFETLGVVASESMQHQSLAAILEALATQLNRLPAPLVARVETLMLRLLPSLGDHVLTAPLDNALSLVSEALRAAHCDGTAARVEDARGELARTIGQLGSRSTRAGRRDYARAGDVEKLYER